MGKSIKQPYPYVWLDEVVEVTLNPEKTHVDKLDIQQLQLIETKFDKELQEVLNNLKADVFCLFSDKKIKATVNHYYDALLLLEQQAMVNLSSYPNGHPISASGEDIILHLRSTSTILKKRYGRYIKQVSGESLTEKKPPVALKLLCKLSVDQIGIILKAADDTKVILASSISVIFHSIVPYLSTAKTKNISWNSMRKSTYHIEPIDKEVAIATLEKLIQKIKDY